MARVFLVIMDSVGCGGAPDAKAFGDQGANTLLHITKACLAGQAEQGRTGKLYTPNLNSLGLSSILSEQSSSLELHEPKKPTGLWGVATETSPGKDTPTGHWELCGVPLPWEWKYFPEKNNSFSKDILDLIQKASNCDGVLGNCHASGTDIIRDYGETHLKNGWPICYTSTDSVVQIAANENTFGLKRLYNICSQIAPSLHKLKIGRVIARPFIGSSKQTFERTKNRKDFSIAPPGPTLCDWAFDEGRQVNSLGKISDIFSGKGISTVRRGSDKQLMEYLSQLLVSAPDGSLNITNFVEFDSIYGHRRDVSGYARHLEWFDAELSKIFKLAHHDDLVLLTADHGNDPTWTGTDHTRERVPVLAFGLGYKEIGNVSFIDISASVASHLNIRNRGSGKSFL
ncbi:MAG: phosphopentomutase [Paracoccaceae bacterium]